MLNLDIEFRKGVLFVRLIGNLIKETSEELKSEIFRIINTSGITNFVINLENVNKIDEKGMDIIYEIEKTLKSNNGSLVICNMPIEYEKTISNNMYIYKSQNELTALNSFNI